MNFFGNLVSNVLLNMLKVVGFALAVWFVTINHDTVQAEREPVVESPTYLMAQCEKAPVGEFPSTVVIQNIGGRANTYMSTDTAEVGKALDVALDGKKWHGKRVIGFCK